MRGYSLLIALFIAGTSAQAAPSSKTQLSPSSPELDACMNRAGAVDSLMAACNFQEEQRWDKRLNVAYSNIMADPTIPNSQKLHLRQQQRMWIKKRDASCAPSADEAGGTAAELNQGGCLLDQTAKQALYLERYRLEGRR